MYELIYGEGSNSAIFTIASVAFASIIGSVTLTGSFIAFGKLQN